MWTVGPAEGGGNQLIPRNDLYDGLALDLAQALVPSALHPAETLGWSGFFISLEATLTTIDAEAGHWRCGIENTGPGGNGGNGVCDSWDVADGVLFVPTVHVRKGLPYSFEFGFQIKYVANSEMVGVGGELRWSPFEGYRNGWAGAIPDIGFRFAGMYLMGSSELVLGILGGGVSISHPFTVSGEMTITPYGGYEMYFVGADQEQVLNSSYVENPDDFNAFCAAGGITECEQQRFLEFHGGKSRNFGQDLATLKFMQAYLGVRFLWERLAVSPQFALTIPWHSGLAEDKVHFQFALSVGTDF
jgi:hypothetical protein